MTVTDIIYRALRTAGVLKGAGQTASPEELADGLDIFNQMLDAWQTERLTIYTVTRTLFTLTAGTQSYTIGTGGVFNVPRPLWIQDAGIISNNNPLQPMELPMAILNDDQWAGVTIKNVASSLSWYLYYDYGFDATGLATIQVWPVPSTSTTQLALYLPTPLAGGYATVTTAVLVPPGYEEALRYNLAVRLCPMFNRPVDIVTANMANTAFANIQRANTREHLLECDPALVGLNQRRIFNWLTGEAGGSRSW